MTTSSARTATAGSVDAPSWTRRALLVVGLAVLAAVTSFAVLAIDGSLEKAQSGLPDPGVLVRHGIPVVRALFDVAACLTVGLLTLAATVLAPEPGTDRLELHGVRLKAVRLGAIAAGAWLVLSIIYLLFTYADVSGTAIGSQGFMSQLSFYIREIDLGRSAVASILIVMLVATGASGATRVFATGWLAALSLVAMFPVALAGHASGSNDHQNAVDSLFVHLLAVSVWVGGLIALILLVPHLGRQLPSAIRRFSTLAAWCFAAVAVSGVVNAWLRVGRIGNLTTDYGILVLVKAALLVVLGVFGWRQRTAILPRLTDGADGAVGRRAFVRFATVEVLVMAFTIGIAVGLSRSATPIPQTATGGDPVAVLVGYVPPANETLVGFFTHWYPDVLWLGITGLMAGCYLFGAIRLHRRGAHWSIGRTASWLTGAAILAWATSGGPAVYGRVFFSGHMVQHMTLMMMVPIFLVLGAPVTLALRTLTRREDDSMGPREWLLAFIHSRFLHVVSNPIIAAVLLIGSLVGFYYTSLFQLSLETHTGHLLMMVHFLLVGYLFVWVLIGVDPGPRRLPYPLRALLLLATVSFHAFFGLAIMTQNSILAPTWWASIEKHDQAALLADQHLGGGFAWGFGELPTLVLVIVIGVMWANADDREAKRLDRKADRDGDAELNAYNEQLAALARGGPGVRGTQPGGSRPPTGPVSEGPNGRSGAADGTRN